MSSLGTTARTRRVLTGHRPTGHDLHRTVIERRSHLLEVAAMAPLLGMLTPLGWLGGRPGVVDEVLAAGAATARPLADGTLEVVREAMHRS